MRDPEERRDTTSIPLFHFDPHMYPLLWYFIWSFFLENPTFQAFLKAFKGNNIFFMCSKVIELPHVRQKSDWDCGIACIQMILMKYLGEEFDSEVLSSLGKSLGFGTSVWTIDLENILVHFKIDCVFYTITCGVDPGYKNQEYYDTCFDEDEARVNKLFENAQELGLNIVRGSVSMEDIISKLKQQWIAVVLIDSMLIQCNLCEQDYQWNSNEFPTWHHYRGHYIILCGYNMEKQSIFYKNPSKDATQCCASFSSFELARHSYGTDEDIIFINLSTEDGKKTLKNITV